MVATLPSPPATSASHHAPAWHTWSSSTSSSSSPAPLLRRHLLLRYALLFSRIHSPNHFAWNTIIQALSNTSSPSHAFSLFLHMRHASPPHPDLCTFPSLFKACSQLGIAREIGAQLHAMCVELGFSSDPYVHSSMISTYAVCGCLSSLHVFCSSNFLVTMSWLGTRWCLVWRELVG